MNEGFNCEFSSESGNCYTFGAFKGSAGLRGGFLCVQLQ